MKRARAREREREEKVVVKNEIQSQGKQASNLSIQSLDLNELTAAYCSGGV